MAGLRARPVNGDVLQSDPQLQGWLESDTESVFDLVRVVCCFRPGPDERIWGSRVLVDVEADPPTASRPLIWSLWPKLVTAGGAMKKTTTVGANLKLVDAATSVESTVPNLRPSIRGMGELQSQAVWLLSAPSTEGLLGDYQFLLIVQRPRGTAALCRVRVVVELRCRNETRMLSAKLPSESSSVRLSG